MGDKVIIFQFSEFQARVILYCRREKARSVLASFINRKENLERITNFDMIGFSTVELERMIRERRNQVATHFAIRVIRELRRLCDHYMKSPLLVYCEKDLIPVLLPQLTEKKLEFKFLEMKKESAAHTI